MNNTPDLQDELQSGYDLQNLLPHAVRGKYAAGTNLVLLDPDTAVAFPIAEAVNDALRLVLQLSRIPTPPH